MLSLSLTFLLSCDSNNSEKADDRVTAGKYEKIYSTILNEERTLIIRLPQGYGATDHSFPVLYLLDAEWESGYLSSVAAAEYLEGYGLAPKMILVGICNTVRNRDIPVKKENRPESGGSKDFLRFITEELMPFIEKRYRTVPYHLLYGGSNAGLFTLFALFESPESFNASIASSPMIGHCPDFMRKVAEEALIKKNLSSRFLYMICGDDDLPGAASYVPDFYQFIKEKSPEGLACQMKVIEKGGHVPYISLHDGLRFVFSGWQFPVDQIEKSDLEDIVGHYARLTEKYGFEAKIPLDSLISLAFGLIEKGDLSQAIETMLLACEIHPYSPDAFYYLGMAYEKDCDINLALSQYKKALEINPDYPPASQKIRQFEKKK